MRCISLNRFDLATLRLHAAQSPLGASTTATVPLGRSPAETARAE